MYICLCRQVTEQKLSEELLKRGGNLSDALKKLGLGTDCGTCIQRALESLGSEPTSRPILPSKSEPKS